MPRKLRLESEGGVYGNETDPVIVAKLIEVLTGTPNEEAKQMLKLLRERQPKK